MAESDDTYLTTVNLREKVIQLRRFLTIMEQSKAEADKIESLKSAVNKLQEELTSQKTITETISEENIDLEHRMADTEKKLAGLEKAIHEMLEKTAKLQICDWRRRLWGKDRPGFIQPNNLWSPRRLCPLNPIEFGHSSSRAIR